MITFFSFLVCNLGLNAILSISIPILNAIYPVAIVLIVLGLSHRFWERNSYTYPMVITGTGLISVIYVLDEAQLPMGPILTLVQKLPLYEMGFGWICVAVVMMVLSILINSNRREKNT